MHIKVDPIPGDFVVCDIDQNYSGYVVSLDGLPSYLTGATAQYYLPGSLTIFDYGLQSGGQLDRDMAGNPVQVWFCPACYVTIAIPMLRATATEEQTQELEPVHKHMAGIDPEEIDWEAHKTFIKGL